MTFGVHRREFLKASVGGLVGATLAPVAFAKSSPLTVTRLTDRMIMISGAGANVLAAREPDGDGVVMVDGGLAENSRALIKHVHKTLGSRDIGVLFNTHWHHAHTGSNLALGKAGAKIVAHENTRLWLTTDIKRPWETVKFEAYPKIAQPNQTFYANGSMPFGDEEIQYGYMLQAHTDGDIFVFFPKENVLVAGGVVSNDGWPLVDWWTGGWINGLVDGLDLLIRVTNDETRVIPANGPILSRADLKAQHEMYRTVAGRLIGMLNKGFGPDEAVAAAPTKEYDAKWGDPKQFVTRAFESLWGHMSPDA
jgi:glyoxylase-like metal-dependent hydrolase (beta-lactamase superfamily II)